MQILKDICKIRLQYVEFIEITRAFHLTPSKRQPSEIV